MNLLVPVHRRSIYIAGLALLLSGLLWAVLQYLHGPLDIAEKEALAANALLMKIHGAAAMFALVLIGSLLPSHVRIGWKLSENRKSGIVMLALAGLLVATGYLLYYSGDDVVRNLASWFHLAVGAALPTPVVVHVWRAMRKRRLARR